MSVFYVFQKKTYQDGLEGGFVWSPRLDKAGHKNNGYTMMTNVKKNDFILHHSDGKMMAISITQTGCFEDKNPSDLYDSWADEGYRINTIYTELDEPLKVADHKSWLASNHKDGSAFTVNGTGKQQYMCLLDDEHAIFLLTEAIKLQQNKETIKVLRDALADIIGETDSEYDQSEKEEINNLIDNSVGDKPVWSGVQRPQELTLSSSGEREIPKRNSKIAADALLRADYKCEYNVKDRVFERKSGKGYTEPHHLIPISKFRDFDYEACSLDTMENIVSLCSHCHNLLHYGKLEDKIPILEKLHNERSAALSEVGLSITLEELIKYYKK